MRFAAMLTGSFEAGIRVLYSTSLVGADVERLQSCRVFALEVRADKRANET